jgi:hypothetical protein
MSHMRTLDYVRVGWIVGTGIGMTLVAANLREALIDLWALNQSPRHTIEVLQIQARGTVWDQLLKIVAMSSLFGIGLAATTERHRTRGQRYLLSVVLMLLNGGCLVVLSWMQNRRRHLISQALRLRRAEHPAT